MRCPYIDLSRLTARRASAELRKIDWHAPGGDVNVIVPEALAAGVRLAIALGVGLPPDR